MVSYFDLYELPVSFHPDPVAVKNKFYELSRRYHPDRFANADDATRSEVLKMAAMNNDAYKTLSSSDATMAAILKQYGLLEDEEKYTLPPTFLMEIMDLNEAVTEYETEGGENMKKQATTVLEELLQSWEDKSEPLTLRFDAGNHDKALLLQVKDYYFRKKYLLRVKERIATFATR